MMPTSIGATGAGALMFLGTGGSSATHSLKTDACLARRVSRQDPPATKGREPASPVGRREVAAVAAIVLLFAAAQGLALLLRRPFAASGIDRAFEDPEDPLNGLYLLLIVLIFTALILFIARKRRPKLIQALILGAVGLTLTFYPLLDLVPHPAFDARQVDLGFGVFHFNWAAPLALVPAVGLTILLKVWPEWYVVNAVGIGISAASIAIFGASFTPLTYLVVLVAFAIYDYVAVYRTKHMLSLADNVLELRLPIMLVVPKHLHYSFLEEKADVRQRAEAGGKKRPRDALFIGLGDIVIPSIFGLTALPLHLWATLGTFAGVLVGLVVLLAFVLRGKPHAGLPTLNAGAFLGFLAGLYLGTGSIVFW
jgi:presenilin-like A22 family membrane protease